MKKPARAGKTGKKSKSAGRPTLSVVIPVYNEEKTMAEILRRVRAVDLRPEIIVVDDGSTDSTRAILASEAGPDLKVIRLKKNSGKGAALQAGIKQARNDVVLIQDADLEYDPMDYHDLIQPLARGEADVVYGSRFLTTKSRRVLFFWHYLMNRFLTMLCNMVTNLCLTDMEVCYKAFKREVIQGVPLREKRFGFEPEVTIKLARRKCRFYEVGISYHGRTYHEGKKVRAKDAIRALYCIFRYGFF
ncbi:glycosyltransferase family 2 protein [candidate division FCPU426 bacterium]|nr:glycosyltransferase family 2 protein [candidate division FCPU426 bacterium]